MRKKISVYIVMVLIMIILPALALAKGDVVVKEMVDALYRYNLSEAVIIETIRDASEVRIDTSVDGLIALKRAGYSDAVIRAIVVRTPGTAAATTTASPSTAGAISFTATQGGKPTTLGPSQFATKFAQSKAKSWTDAVNGGGGTLGLAALSASTTVLGHAGSMLGLGAGIAALGMIGRGQNSVNGFQVQYLPGQHATTVLDSATAELAVNLAAFNDGKYARAEVVLLRLDVIAKDNARVIAAAKGAYKGHDRNDARFEGAPFRYEGLPMESARDQQSLAVRLPALAAGDYAIGFVFEGDLLPEVLDFMVR